MCVCVLPQYCVQLELWTEGERESKLGVDVRVPGRQNYSRRTHPESGIKTQSESQDCIKERNVHLMFLFVWFHPNNSISEGLVRLNIEDCDQLQLQL